METGTLGWKVAEFVLWSVMAAFVIGVSVEIARDAMRGGRR